MGMSPPYSSRKPVCPHDANHPTIPTSPHPPLLTCPLSPTPIPMPHTGHYPPQAPIQTLNRIPIKQKMKREAAGEQEMWESVRAAPT